MNLFSTTLTNQNKTQKQTAKRKWRKQSNRNNENQNEDLEPFEMGPFEILWRSEFQCEEVIRSKQKIIIITAYSIWNQNVTMSNFIR